MSGWMEPPYDFEELDDEDVYPDVDDDRDGLDAVVRELSEMDEAHHTKAAGLLMAARTEFVWAMYDEEIDRDLSFEEFASVTLDEADNILDDDE